MEGFDPFENHEEVLKKETLTDPFSLTDSIVGEPQAPVIGGLEPTTQTPEAVSYSTGTECPQPNENKNRFNFGLNEEGKGSTEGNSKVLSDDYDETVKTIRNDSFDGPIVNEFNATDNDSLSMKDVGADEIPRIVVSDVPDFSLNSVETVSGIRKVKKPSLS